VLPITLAQGLWSVLLGLVAGYWLWRGGVVPGAVLLGLIALYAFLITSLHQRKRWAWWLCWIPPIIALVLAGPNVIYNVVLYFRDDPRYLDSPGTILIVSVNAVLFVLPALCILGLLLRVRTKMSPNNSFERTREG
jgi:hypothetical protein